jgi:hypothetical protein
VRQEQCVGLHLPRLTKKSVPRFVQANRQELFAYFPYS